VMTCWVAISIIYANIELKTEKCRMNNYL
jgi:hypothetical protein